MRQTWQIPDSRLSTTVKSSSCNHSSTSTSKSPSTVDIDDRYPVDSYIARATHKADQGSWQPANGILLSVIAPIIGRRLLAGWTAG